MQVSSLLVVLSKYEGIVSLTSGSNEAAALRDIRQLFTGNEAESAIPFLNKLIKQRDQRGRGTNAPQVANLREWLTKLEELLRAAESKKAADDVAKLAALLEGCSQASVAELVNEARGWLASPAKPKSKSGSTTGRKSPGPAIESISPAQYAAELKGASCDNVRFDALVTRLGADRGIKKDDMREVARLYLGFEINKKKGRANSLAAIVDKQAVEARQDARGSLLDRLKPW